MSATGKGRGCSLRGEGGGEEGTVPAIGDGALSGRTAPPGPLRWMYWELWREGRTEIF